MSETRVKVILHGYLKKLYPQDIFLSGHTCAEIINGLKQLLPDLKQRPGQDRKLIQAVGYATHESLFEPLTPDTKEIHIVPAMVGGKGLGGIFRIVLGVVLIGAALWLGAGFVGFGVQIGGVGGLLFNAGVSLILGGLIEFFSPQPKSTSGASTPGSNYFGSSGNTVKIGTRIALLYGRMKVFGQILSFNVDATVDSAQTVPATGGTPPTTVRGKPIPNLVAAGIFETGQGVKLYDAAAAYAPVTFSTRPFANGDETKAVRFSRDGSLMAVVQLTSNDPANAFFLFDTTTLRETSCGHIPRRNQPYYEAVAFSPTMIGLAADSGSIADFQIFDLASLRLKHSISNGTGGDGNCIAFSPDGTLMAIGSYSGSGAYNNLRVINTSTWADVTLNVTAIGSKHEVQDVQFSPNGAWLAVTVRNAVDGKVLHLYDTTTWTHSSAIAHVLDSGWTSNVDWAPDSSYCVVSETPNSSSTSWYIQPHPGPYESPINKVAPATLVVTKLLPPVTGDFGANRQFHTVYNPAMVTGDGAYIIANDAWLPDAVMWDAATNALLGSSLISTGGHYIQALARKGQI